MTQKTINIFIDETDSKPPKKKHNTNKTDVYLVDDTWSLDILDWKDNGPKNIRGYKYALVVIDNLSELGWTVPLKSKSDRTIQNFFENKFTTSRRKPKLSWIRWWKGIERKIFTDLLYENNC